MAKHWGSDLHSAAGHFLPETGAGAQCAPDCPRCKYGTLAILKDEAACIDCGATFDRDKLVEDGVLPKRARGEA